MYLIKKHFVATEDNPHFKGVVKDYYEGRGSSILSINQIPEKYYIEEYGYRTISGANKGLKKAQELAELETAYGYWNVSVELIEINL